MNKTIQVAIPIAALALGVGLTAGYVGAQQQSPTEERQAPPQTARVVIHLTKDSGDLHAISMALDLARTLQTHGGKVTLFLDLEGVRLQAIRQQLIAGANISTPQPQRRVAA